MADGDYFVLATVKTYAPTIVSAADDTVVNDFGAVENKHFDNKMRPYLDVVPVVEASITDDQRFAVNAEVTSMWFTHIKEHKSAEVWHEKSLQAYEDLIIEAKSNAELRSRPESYSQSSSSNLLKDIPGLTDSDGAFIESPSY